MTYSDADQSDATDPIRVPQIGSELHRIRKQAGLTLDELSRLARVSKSLLSQIERDQANPTYLTLWRVCLALKKTPDSLFGQTNLTSDSIEIMSERQTPTIRSEDGRCKLRILGSLDCANIVQWYLLEAQPVGILTSDAHGLNSLEHLYVLTGTLTIQANNLSISAKAGETARYPTRVGQHTISNLGSEEATALMVCLL